MNVALFRRRYEPTIHKYDYYKHPKITISPLRLHAASSVRIRTATHSFRTLLPTVRMRPLNLFSASSVDLQGASNTNILLINLRVRLSPIKSSVLRKYPNLLIRLGMYISISKCNAKSCNCCEHLCTKTTITSSVNGRTFTAKNNSDLDRKSESLIYVLT